LDNTIDVELNAAPMEREKEKGFVPSRQSGLIDHVRPTDWLIKSGYHG
jgi:hypothetical protein